MQRDERAAEAELEELAETRNDVKKLRKTIDESRQATARLECQKEALERTLGQQTLENEAHAVQVAKLQNKHLEVERSLAIEKYKNSLLSSTTEGAARAP